MAKRRFSRTGAMAKAAAKRAAPKPKAEPGQALGVVFVVLGIVLLTGGALAFLFASEISAPREGILGGGAAAGLLGIGAITYYFHKFGKL